jgi:hypothetical protein
MFNNTEKQVLERYGDSSLSFLATWEAEIKRSQFKAWSKSSGDPISTNGCTWWHTHVIPRYLGKHKQEECGPGLLPRHRASPYLKNNLQGWRHGSSGRVLA